jgi:uncharacterized protein
VSCERRPRAYIDIETTGVDPEADSLTVIGIAIERQEEVGLVQLYEGSLTRKGLIAALEGVDSLYSWNGLRFDLPFIAARLEVNLAESFRHCDLKQRCRQCGLFGGLKGVERRLGISRVTAGMNGRDAVRLWNEYRSRGNSAALKRLLAYNAEDVRNLAHIRRRLRVE